MAPTVRGEVVLSCVTAVSIMQLLGDLGDPRRESCGCSLCCRGIDDWFFVEWSGNFVLN